MLITEVFNPFTAKMSTTENLLKRRNKQKQKKKLIEDLIMGVIFCYYLLKKQIA